MNDLFFTLLLYNKAKERRYKFYDCLVAHDGAYLDLNRLIEPTDILTVTYKIFFQDAVEDAWRSHAGGLPTQQFIVCARTTYLDENHVEQIDPNTVLVSPFPFYRGSSDWDGTPHSILGNGTTLSGQNHYYDFGENAFDKKVTVTIKQTSSDIYVHNTEKLISPIKGNRHLVEGRDRALLKLFAGFHWLTGQLVLNGCDSRIYSFHIQNANDEYTMRLQPAEDLSTGELGMYDSINDMFYPNKNSVGYFTVEEDITDKIVLDVESQIDTRKWQILFTSNNMPFQLSNGQLCAVPVSYSTPPLFANPNGTPATDGDFIDAWIRMGLPSDEVGLFNNTVLNRNQNSDVTYINNGDGSVTAKVGDDESPDGDYTRYAYQLNDIALSMVLIGNFEDIEYSDNSGFIIVTRPVGSNLNGGFRWRDVKSGRKAKNFLKDGESAGAQDIFFDTETSAVWTATGSTNQAEGDTLIGVMDNRPMGLRIYGMALYRSIHTTAELLQVAEWLDSLTKRPVQTREITSES